MKLTVCLRQQKVEQYIFGQWPISDVLRAATFKQISKALKLLSICQMKSVWMYAGLVLMVYNSEHNSHEQHIKKNQSMHT